MYKKEWKDESCHEVRTEQQYCSCSYQA